ncbi:hypothetical protein [Zhongshania sp.]|uniref:allophanate hydrolase-related protein n=1 Tax=Zhongshania sp. TaxID=1971902 RepID=UPI00356AEF82
MSPAVVDRPPLNRQLTERGGYLLEKHTLTPNYKLYVLAGGPPFRPGMVIVPASSAALSRV